ncbi:lysine-specific demethylase 3A-like [Teleopsis dalmanni]|uniref:lysine-specific demethylase 3A-like n=2 Tax=Teleopsis dalmanni TaxID=139649 RepID=UPI0018CEBAE4|nr:lysine-specific demethylase 3A-like [Teleopsis dalmanni]
MESTDILDDQDMIKNENLLAIRVLAQSMLNEIPVVSTDEYTNYSSDNTPDLIHAQNYVQPTVELCELFSEKNTEQQIQQFSEQQLQQSPNDLQQSTQQVQQLPEQNQPFSEEQSQQSSPQETHNFQVQSLPQSSQQLSQSFSEQLPQEFINHHPQQKLQHYPEEQPSSLSEQQSHFTGQLSQLTQPPQLLQPPQLTQSPQLIQPPELTQAPQLTQPIQEPLELPSQQFPVQVPQQSIEQLPQPFMKQPSQPYSQESPQIFSDHEIQQPLQQQPQQFPAHLPQQFPVQPLQEFTTQPPQFPAQHPESCVQKFYDNFPVYSSTTPFAEQLPIQPTQPYPNQSPYPNFEQQPFQTIDQPINQFTNNPENSLNHFIPSSHLLSNNQIKTETDNILNDFDDIPQFAIATKSASEMSEFDSPTKKQIQNELNELHERKSIIEIHLSNDSICKSTQNINHEDPNNVGSLADNNLKMDHLNKEAKQKNGNAKVTQGPQKRTATDKSKACKKIVKRAAAALDVPEDTGNFIELENAAHPIEQLTPEEECLDQKYRTSCATFLQHLPCFKIQSSAEHTITKCRECRRHNSSSNDVYCRFYEFRRLQYTANGELNVAGFPNPYTEPTQEDLNIWQPDDNTAPTAGVMDIQVCRYILLHAGDQFCYLWRQEAEALKLHENPDSTIAWKKVVQGIREICDVCDTTLFNYHWTCNKCGLGVCLDCFKDRKEQRTCRKMRDKPQRGRDEFHWFLCNGAAPHKLSELMLTQIIAGDALNVLGRLLHEVRAVWQVPQLCGCLLSKQRVTDPELNAFIQDMIKESQLKQQTSASSLATEATLRQQERMEDLHRNKLEFARAAGIDYVPGRVWTKKTLGKDAITTAFDKFKKINFLRDGLAGKRRFLPPQAMTLAHTMPLARGVPHEWLCDGKLLRLTNAMHPDNRILFQEVWKCGQPVMISEVANSLNLNLWKPEAFCRDFGDKPNDLINCLNGNLVPNQPMRHFWEGFQFINKRLLDSHGKPMLLKLKDWPPGDDFAEILPTRYGDLMKGLPMPEYTLRTGNLNIASCLPKMFVPPDLGPKMYNAYGSALHPDKGTTNLHLDISDAVNIMVYVGIPADTDSAPQLKATSIAISLSGADFLTRVRLQSPDVMPGALWHIFPARDADKIRDLLNRVTLERGFRLEPDHDPIHDQNWYLDDELRMRLLKEYGVEGYPIVQCLGDAVFIPAGAPHQVQNLHNCIKVAEDFVSPENITHCYHLTHEFRRLSHSHTNHEDKLQIKNIIYHAIKDCCTILVRAIKEKAEAEIAELEKQKESNS